MGEHLCRSEISVKLSKLPFLKNTSEVLLLKSITFLLPKQSPVDSNDTNKCKIDKIIFIDFKV